MAQGARQHDQSGDDPGSDRPDTSGWPLRAFGGAFALGLAFESGHSLLFADVTDAPTDPGSYRAVWIVGPENRRTLVVDDPAALPVAQRYHALDVAHVGEVSLARAGRGLALAVAGERDLTLTARLTRTVRSVLLTATARVTPRAVIRNDAARPLAERLVGRLLGWPDVALAGRTGVGARFRQEIDRVRAITAVDASLDGRDLGSLTTPDPGVAFGDLALPPRPLFVEGTLFLPHPE